MTACTAATALALVSRFVGDYNHGRAAAAASRFAPEPAFQWFSGPHRLGPRAYDRATLAAYFRSRHAPIAIVKVSASYDPARNIVNFAGKLPNAKDFKGAAACTSRGPVLIVWSM